MMDGFKKKLEGEPQEYSEPEYETVTDPITHVTSYLRKEEQEAEGEQYSKKSVPKSEEALYKTDKEFIGDKSPTDLKEKAYIGILCPKCGAEINVTESWHNQFESYENPIAKHIYKDVIEDLSKLNEKMITVESEEYNFRNQPVVHWSNIHNLIEEYKKKLKDLETEVSR